MIASVVIRTDCDRNVSGNELDVVDVVIDVNAAAVVKAMAASGSTSAGSGSVREDHLEPGAVGRAGFVPEVEGQMISGTATARWRGRTAIFADS